MKCSKCQAPLEAHVISCSRIMEDLHKHEQRDVYWAAMRDLEAKDQRIAELEAELGLLKLRSDSLRTLADARLKIIEELRK